MAILELVTLSFDPMESDHPELKKIVVDPLAWMLWLAIKQGHAASQHFNRRILRCASEIRGIMDGGILEVNMMFWLLVNADLIGPQEKPFAEELLVFIQEEKKIQYKVEK